MRERRFQRRESLPPAYRSARERRERVISLALVAGLQAAITVALVVASFQTYRMWRQGIAYVPGGIARAVPVSFGMGAIIAALATLRSLTRLRSAGRVPVDSGRDG